MLMPDLSEMIQQIAEQVKALEERMDSPMYGEEIRDPDDL